MRVMPRRCQPPLRSHVTLARRPRPHHPPRGQTLPPLPRIISRLHLPTHPPTTLYRHIPRVSVHPHSQLRARVNSMEARTSMAGSRASLGGGLRRQSTVSLGALGKVSQAAAQYNATHG